MNAEQLFLYYRHKADTYDQRLYQIEAAAQTLQGITIRIPQSVADNPFEFFSDSRYEDEVANDEVREWVEQDVVPLFKEKTLLLLSVSGTIHGFDATTARNLEYELDQIVKLAGIEKRLFYDDPIGDDPPRFCGFRPSEVERFLHAMKRRAEDRLERLRNINTNTKYMAKARLGVHNSLRVPAYNALLPTALAYHTNGMHKTAYPVFHSYWLTCTVDKIAAAAILRLFEDIQTYSAPEEGQPDTLDFFGSNKSNRISLEVESS